MFSHRLFNIVIAIVLIALIGITAQEVSATAAVISPIGPSNTVCASLPSHFSIHTEYVEGTGTWMTFTEDGPTGIDGGLIHLLSNRRNCSQ